MNVAKAHGSTVLKNLTRIGALGVVQRVCKECGVLNLGALLEPGKRRNYKSLTLARRRIWMILRHTRPDLSYPDIGRLFGGMDHTTILSGVRKAERELQASYAA